MGSLFKYSWTRQQAEFLNNQMFRHLAMRPQYMVQVEKGQTYLIGDHLGQPAENRWLAFNVSEATGLPSGCNAFDEAKKWSDDTTSKGYAGPIDCPLQTYAPEGEPLHSIVEEFADDQNAWLRDFLPALQKMVENRAEDLVESPSTWWSAECKYVDRRKNLACS